LVRGLDYYTKTTFEIISSKLGAQDAILGGGRYDDMMKEFGGPDICGIGFAVGLERFLSIVPFEETNESFLYIAFLGDSAKKTGMELARQLRKEGVECLMEYRDRNLKNQMSRANKLGAAWALIIGEDEVKAKRYQLKNMQTGDQQEVSAEEILVRVHKPS
jgi:histidyl-tRNA synthetase